jgi:molybdopterin-guanine dinucleotide biosynthesis protein MobB
MPSTLPPVVSIIGRRDSGKTTLLVLLAAELGRRGLRVASVKHSHHDVDIDHPGKDSWRHFHEGGVDAVLLATPNRVSLLARDPGADSDPAALIHRYFHDRDLDVVLVEAFKQAPFPKLEVFRRAVHEQPLYDGDPAGLYLAILTDAPASLHVPVPVIPLAADGTHVRAAADLVQEHLDRTARTRAAE